MAKKKVAKKQPVTALAKRVVKKAAPKTTALMKATKPVEIIPAPGIPVTEKTLAEVLGLASTLDNAIAMGDVGLVEIKLTKEEEAVLARPVNITHLRVIPDQNGTVYLPHTAYARWLTDAFGRTGWGMRQASLPQVNEGLVVMWHILLIHGQPVKAALGEQEYHANNRTQSYGDAIEATRGNALRRCCKQLNIGLELWDKEGFIQPYLEEFCVRVWNEKTGKHVWRRKVDGPFFWEEKGTNRSSRRVTREDEQQRAPAQPVEPVAHHGKAKEPITDGQKQRLWTIARRRGRTDEEVKAYLMARGYKSSGDVTREDYDTVITALEHPGDLDGWKIDTVLPLQREPGSDDE